MAASSCPLVDPDGERTMASDRGVGADLRPEELQPVWLECDHLHVSGYTLASDSGRATAARAILLARGHGARVSVDLAAATVIETIGTAAFRALLSELTPEVVFCTANEEAAAGGRAAGPIWIVKHGARGVTVDDTAYAAAETAHVVDATGAGDAFAAGWIVGGVPSRSRRPRPVSPTWALFPASAEIRAVSRSHGRCHVLRTNDAGSEARPTRHA